MSNQINVKAALVTGFLLVGISVLVPPRKYHVDQIDFTRPGVGFSKPIGEMIYLTPLWSSDPDNGIRVSRQPSMSVNYAAVDSMLVRGTDGNFAVGFWILWEFMPIMIAAMLIGRFTRQRGGGNEKEAQAEFSPKAASSDSPGDLGSPEALKPAFKAYSRLDSLKEREILSALRSLCRAYEVDDRTGVAELEPLATLVGEELNRRGGFSEMKRVWARLENIRGTQALAVHWNGIGEWRVKQHGNGVAANPSPQADG